MTRSSGLSRHRNAGFTLVELMVVVVIIGLLATLGISNFVRSKRNAQAARTAAELRSFASAFTAYMVEYGNLPPDSHANLPPGMDAYLDPALWADETPIGGHYNWEGFDTYPYAGIAVFNSNAPLEVLVTLDALLDDGNLAVGKFRTGTSGRPTYILFE